MPYEKVESTLLPRPPSREDFPGWFTPGIFHVGTHAQTVLPPLAWVGAAVSLGLVAKRLMNRAIWLKAFRDAWLQLALSSLLLVVFCWLFTWLMSQFDAGAWTTLLDLMPRFVQPLLGVPLSELAKPAGQLSVLFVHIITLLVCLGWAVGRGSDPVAGEISRGTMDLILALPVRRATVLLVPGLVATVGAVILAASVLIGIWLGTTTNTFSSDLAVVRFLPGAVNLFSMTFCMTGITSLISSWDHDRWRTIWLAGGFFAVSSVVEMVSRLWSPGWWLKFTTILTAFEPQLFILVPEAREAHALTFNLTLLAIGLVGFSLATLVFSYRDIPVAV